MLDDIDINQRNYKEFFNRNNLYIRIGEFFIAGILSAMIHSLAYDFGDKFDNLDLSKYE